MDKNLQIPGTYIIRYETASVVPAPFSHYYSLKLDMVSETGLRIDFSIRYTDRDELSEEEIYDEGFTTDDDYRFSGEMPALWIGEFDTIFSSSKMIRKREENEYEDFIEIELDENDKRVTIYPVDKERWTYFLQEIMQAVFETGKKEKPFELSYLEIGSDGPTSVQLNASFANKTFTISKNGEPSRKLGWDQLQKVMDTVYRADFVAEQATTTKPSKPGKYMTAGDGLWYQMGVSILETTNKSKDLPRIEALFSKLAEKI